MRKNIQKITILPFLLLMAIIIILYSPISFHLKATTSRAEFSESLLITTQDLNISRIEDFIAKVRINPNISTTDGVNKNFVANIPDIYFDGSQLPSSYNKSCAKFPKLLDIKFTSDYWQTQKISNGTLQFFSAYLDHREMEHTRSVRIMVMYDHFSSPETFYCQFWFKKVKEPVLIKSEKLLFIWKNEWDGNYKDVYYPYIITCPLPPDELPLSVSIVENSCDNPTNNLKVFSKDVKDEEKKSFVVCVKGLNFPFEDNSIRLIEWIELVFILGAEKINFYKFHVHPNVQRVLDYYSSNNSIEVTPISLIGGASNSPYLQSKFLKNKIVERRLQEVIPYNDCLYKHLKEFRFVVLLDTDEVIVPANGITWMELLQNIKDDNISSYMARNVYFLDSYQHNHDWFEDIPKFLHMLQHVHRARNYTGTQSYIKGFHDTRKAVALHNHLPIRCFTECKRFDIDTSNGHLQHYRSDCSRDGGSCDLMRNNSVIDTRIWNYKNVLIKKTLQVFFNLDIISLSET